eukprot:SAG31_NODE_23900_length_493_cov_0.814721_1_plen_29_part_10
METASCGSRTAPPGAGVGGSGGRPAGNGG